MTTMNRISSRRRPLPGGGLLLVVAVGLALQVPVCVHAQVSEQLVDAYLWPRTAADVRDAEAALAAAPGLVGVSRMQMHDLEELIRRGPATSRESGDWTTGETLNELTVSAPGGRSIPVYEYDDMESLDV